MHNLFEKFVGLPTYFSCDCTAPDRVDHENEKEKISNSILFDILRTKGGFEYLTKNCFEGDLDIILDVKMQTLNTWLDILVGFPR